MMSWFAEKVKQGKSGKGREAGPQQGKREDGGRRAKMTAQGSPSKKAKGKMAPVVSQLAAFFFFAKARPTA